MEPQEKESPELAQKRQLFSDTMLRLVLNLRERHPERFPAFDHPALQQKTPEVEARLIVRDYVSRIVNRSIVFLDEILYETCLHVGIEPSLNVMFDHVGARSEEEVVSTALRQLKAENVIGESPELSKMINELKKLVQKQLPEKKTAP